MSLKTFRGPSFETLLSRAQDDFGPDAMVLQSRTLYDPFGQQNFIVVAGDPRSVAETRETMTGPSRGGASRTAFSPRVAGSPRGAPLTIALVGYFVFLFKASDKEYREVIDEKFGNGK